MRQKAFDVGIGIIIVISLGAYSQAYGQVPEIKVKEWDVPTANSAPHDIVVDEKNGIVWFTEINTNKIGMFDPVNEEFLEFDIPTPSSGPHGIVVDDSGNIWFTEMAASKIGKLYPETGEIEEYPTPTLNSGPHTPIMGPGVVWFTEIDASNIARLNITTGAIDEFQTPTGGSSPYGIIVDSEGNAWYSALTGHRIGKVDSKTGEITEYPTPTNDSGTRRIAIDSKGMLWFTEYNVGKIGSFDPKTNEFKEYETISQSSNPYAIWVDIYDNVWFSMTGAYKVGKFDQSTGTMSEYDLPTPRTIIRFIYSDNHGDIWFPNNSNNKIGMITQSLQQSPFLCEGSGFAGFSNEYTLSIDGKEYSGRYFGNISRITANVEKSAIEIDTTADCLVIELSRELIDSTRDGRDIPFTVLIVGVPSNATNEEMDSPDNRVLQINLPSTSPKMVEIIGTSIAPEFGTILAVLIPIAMIGIIVLAKAANKKFGM